MKNILKKPFVRKLLIYLGAIIVLIILLNNYILPWYVSSPETKVPNVEGMQESNAVKLLEDGGFEPMIADTNFNEKFPAGTVLLQRPEEGKVVKEGRRVYLFISGGEPVVMVPVLKGKSLRDAKFALERLGLKLGNVEEVPSSNPRNMIFDQQYAVGTPLKKGDSVGVSVSIGQGGGEIVIPDLIGKSLAEAEKILSDSSLTVGKINYQTSFSLLPNTVLDQYPSKGNKADKGDAVDLFVTKSSEKDDKIKEE